MPKAKMPSKKVAKKIKKNKKIKNRKNESIKNDGIFNFDEQVIEEPRKKVTKTAQKRKKSKKAKNVDLDQEHFIGENEVKHIDKKKLEKIKKEKLKEKRTKEKELAKEQKRQAKIRKQRAKQTKKARMTEEQIKRNRRIKTIIKLFLLLAVIAGIIIYLMLSPIFNIKNINVEGNSNISSEQIISLSKVQKDTNLFKVSNKDTMAAIKENPYIKTVEIKRTLPDTITFVITERVATYMLEYGGSFAYIDNKGYILEISANTKEGLAKITGYETSQDEITPGSRLCQNDLEKLNTVLRITASAKTNNIDSLITSINIEDSSNYTLFMESEQKKVYLGDCTNLDTRMLYVKAILEKEKGIAGEIFVDMNLNEKYPYFRQKV